MDFLSVKKNGTMCRFLLFSVTRYNYPKRPRLLMHNFRHLHLSFCFYDQASPVLRSFTFPCCLFCYLTTSKLCQAHQKHIVTRTRVSRSKSPDQQTHFCVVLAPAIRFWWTCWVLPPGPQCLRYEGITTISLLYDTPIYVSTRSDPPPRFENVETIIPTRIPRQQRPHQWPNCNPHSFVVPPCFQLDHGIQQQGHCNYREHDQHD